VKNEIIILDEFNSILMVFSKKYGPQECLIDTEDIQKLKCLRWTVKSCHSSLFYAHTHTGTTTKTMHRLVMGNPDGVVDHINGNCLDNRKSNLRVVSYSENRRNSTKQINTKCRYRGVYERNDYPGKYRAQLRHNGNIKNLGTFTCPKEAALVYDKYAKEVYGEFAVTNFPT
jgi:hypothetical protein